MIRSVLSGLSLEQFPLLPAAALNVCTFYSHEEKHRCPTSGAEENGGSGLDDVISNWPAAGGMLIKLFRYERTLLTVRKLHASQDQEEGSVARL